ncbi:DUF4256 domain-containing protein [Patescibacteria group bacterium]
MELKQPLTEEIFDPQHLCNEDLSLLRQMHRAKDAGVDDAIYDDPIERGLLNARILNTINFRIIEPGYDLSEVDRYQIIQELLIRFRYLQSVDRNDSRCSLIRTTLENSDDSILRSIIAMEKAGHEPCVFQETERGFYIGSAVKETPENERNCVLNQTQREDIPSCDSNSKSAIEMADEMGVRIMTLKEYSHLRKNCGQSRNFDFEGETWLVEYNHRNFRKKRIDHWAANGYPVSHKFNLQKRARRSNPRGVHEISGTVPSPHRGWRGSMFVEWKTS